MKKIISNLGIAVVLILVIIFLKGGLFFGLPTTEAQALSIQGTGFNLSPNPVDTLLSATGSLIGGMQTTLCYFGPENNTAENIPTTPSQIQADQLSIKIDGAVVSGAASELTQTVAGVAGSCSDPAGTLYHYNYEFTINTTAFVNGTVHTAQVCAGTYCTPVTNFTVQHAAPPTGTVTVASVNTANGQGVNASWNLAGPLPTVPCTDALCSGIGEAYPVQPLGIYTLTPGPSPSDYALSSVDIAMTSQKADSDLAGTNHLLTFAKDLLPPLADAENTTPAPTQTLTESGIGFTMNWTPAAELSVSPNAVSLTSANPSQTVTVSNTGASGSTLNWGEVTSYSNGSGWLSVSPSSGSLPGGQATPVSFVANTLGLAPGTYNAIAKISPTGLSGPSVPVTLIVGSTPTASLSINKTSFAVGDPWTLTLSSNIPNAAFSICATKNGASLGCTPEGNTNSSGSATVTGTFASGDVGSWVESAEFSSPAFTTNNISFTVSQPSGPTLSFQASPTSIALGQSVSLVWSSTNANSCTASASPSESDWMGSETAGQNEQAVITPSAASSYTYTLQCAGPGGSVTQSVSVSVTNNPTNAVTLSASPNPTDTGTPVNLTATLGGSGSGPANYDFWWNCSYTGTDLTAATAACGSPTVAGNGAEFNDESGASYATSHVYASTGTYTPTVIVNRGSASPAESQETITVSNTPTYYSCSGNSCVEDDANGTFTSPDCNSACSASANSGSVSVCAAIEDQNGNITDGSGTVIAGQSFTVPGFSFKVPGEAGPDGLLPSTTFTIPLTLNTAIFSSVVGNAECVTYTNLPLDHYFYGTSTPQLGPTLYDDQLSQRATTISDMSPYDPAQYEPGGNTNSPRSLDSDGEVSLTSGGAVRQIIVLVQTTSTSSGNGNGSGGYNCVSNSCVAASANPQYPDLSSCNAVCGSSGNALTATLVADPSSGAAPLAVALNATAGGTAQGTLNYTFWQDCSYSGSSVASATAQCGAPIKKDDGVSWLSDIATSTYNNVGSFNPLVIIERGSSAAAAPATVVVSSGNGAEHAACVSDSCTLVSGQTSDDCTTGSACVDGNFHNVCENNSCTQITGAGSDQCPTIGSSCTSGNTHFECVNNACTSVAGAGVNRCGTDADCGGGGTGGDMHDVCDPVQQACVNVAGAGTDTCSSDTACSGGGITHLSCETNSCVIVSGSGSNQCTTPGSPCIPPGWGYSCSNDCAAPVNGGPYATLSTCQSSCVAGPPASCSSLVANPGLIVPPGTANLSWTCTNVTSCMLNGTAVPVSSNSYQVAPTATTQYNLLCSGSDGSTATSSAVITVNGPGVHEINP